MDSTTCYKCGQSVRLGGSYCLNCGQKISFTTYSTSTPTQILLYLKALLFPPLGFAAGRRYLRQSDSKSLLIGVIAISISFIETTLLLLYLGNLATSLQSKIVHQLAPPPFKM